MTPLDPYAPLPSRFGLLRDLLALLLLAVGAVGLVVVGLHVPWQANVAAGSLAAIAAGASLGMTR
jgi:hypothetical protein